MTRELRVRMRALDFDYQNASDLPEYLNSIVIFPFHSLLSSIELLPLVDILATCITTPVA